MSQLPNMEEILIDYLDGTLDATRRKAVETLLKHDAKMRKSLAAMRQVRGALRDLPIEPMPAAAASSLQEQLRPPAEPSIPLYSPKWLIRLAAAFAIAVTAGLIIWSMLPRPMDQHTVAMQQVFSPGVSTVAFDTKKDSAVAELGATMEPSLATKVGTDQLRADEAASENESTLVVVVANDIGGTEREIRNLLTLNNINYESVPASAAERDEAAKEAPMRGGRTAADAAREAAAPAPAEARAETEKTEMKDVASAGPAPAAAAPPAVATPAASGGAATPSAAPALAQSGRASGMGGGAGAGAGGQGMARGPQREVPQAFASAKPTGQQLGGATQRRSQAATGRTTLEPYGMVVARNVTPDQLGRIRSGLRDASRTGNMRVVEPSADRVKQAADRQALSRAEQTDNYQQLQKQNAWQYSNSQAIQNTQNPQELALQSQNSPQRPISYSARYDVTIVVQGEAAANAATLPAQSSPATTPSATAPAAP